jgi:chromosome segregation ATPase
MSRYCLCLTFYSLLWIFTAGCAGLARQDKSPDQIAAEKALTGKKTALLERENQVLRDENLELTRSGELIRADLEKKQAEFSANDARRAAELKSAEANIANLTQKIAILESESGGKIKQLTQLNEQLSERHTKEREKLQEDLKRAQVEGAAEKDRLIREAAEKQFAHGKEVQELKQRTSEKEKEIDEMRRALATLRENEARLQKEIQELKSRTAPVAPAAK